MYFKAYLYGCIRGRRGNTVLENLWAVKRISFHSASPGSLWRHGTDGQHFHYILLFP